MSLRFQSRVKHVSTKLLVLLLTCMACGTAIVGYLDIRLHGRDLEQVSLAQAIEISDFVAANTHHSMLANDRAELSDTLRLVGTHSEIESIRILNHSGQVAFSSDSRELGTTIPKESTQCVECHRNAAGATEKHFRIYEVQGPRGKYRVLGTIAPILNRPECYNSACHAHPKDQRILGILDTDLSLERADAALANSNMWAVIVLAIGGCVLGVLVWVAVRVVLHKPLMRLKEGTGHLSEGELGYQIPVESADELGELAQAFNRMSSLLQAAQREITSWTHTLEHRVEQKTSELQKTQQQMLQVERMIAIGKMSAVVAHEINNPLAGILTYAKLIKKWIDRGIKNDEQKREAMESLDLIANESKRCGELLQNLLSFSRTAPMNLSLSDLNGVVARTVRLAEHKAEISGVLLQVDLDRNLPPLHCDAAQIEQVALALVINAIDAMPHGGNLWISTRTVPEEKIELLVRDDGVGIPPEILPHIFDPFTTTKEVGKGVGLGLAVSKGIVERHGGRIEVSSELGVGTTFRVILPMHTAAAAKAQTEAVVSGAPSAFA